MGCCPILKWLHVQHILEGKNVWCTDNHRLFQIAHCALINISQFTYTYESLFRIMKTLLIWCLKPYIWLVVCEKWSEMIPASYLILCQTTLLHSKKLKIEYNLFISLTGQGFSGSRANVQLRITLWNAQDHTLNQTHLYFIFTCFRNREDPDNTMWKVHRDTNLKPQLKQHWYPSWHVAPFYWKD